MIDQSASKTDLYTMFYFVLNFHTYSSIQQLPFKADVHCNVVSNMCSCVVNNFACNV